MMQSTTRASFLLGLLSGAVLMLLWQGRTLDKQALKLSHLTMLYQELEEENVQLSAQIHAPENTLSLKAIKVSVDAPDGMTQLQVTQFAKQQLEFLVGRSMDIFIHDPDLAAHLINGRTTVVNDHAYALRVTSTIIVNETMYLQIRAVEKT